MYELFGYAAVFYRADMPGTEYPIEPGRSQRFRPGAFDRSLSRRRGIVCNLNHNGEMFLGTTEDGTVRLAVDDIGLRFVVDLSRCAYARTVHELARDGMFRGASTEFRTRDRRTFTEGGILVTEWLSVDLLAFSPVFDPAYTATGVAVRGGPRLVEACGGRC